jgi:hypothetical protein
MARPLLLLVGLAATVRLVAAVPQSPQALPTAAVSGVVTDYATHEPIAGARVFLAPPPKPPGRMAWELTDARGRFVFTNVPLGEYGVRSEKPGYSGGQLGGPGLNTETITLTDGMWFKTANISLVKFGAIGGTVTDERGEAVVGAYVRLLVPFKLAGTPQIAAGPAVKTDDRGAYRIANLPAGTYFVEVPSVQHSVQANTSMSEIEGADGEPSRNGGVLLDGLTALILGNYVTPPPPIDGRWQAYPPIFYPGVASFGSAQPVHVSYGADQSGVDIALRPVGTVRVAGALEGPADAAAGLVLRLMPQGLENLGVGSEAATAVVGRDGSFRFANVPAGDYVIAPGPIFEFTMLATSNSELVNPTHRAFGPLPVTPAMGKETHQSSGSYIRALGLESPVAEIGRNTFTPDVLDRVQTGYARVPVSVSDRDVAGITIPLERPATLHCTVVFEEVSGGLPTGNLQVQPANGSPALPGRNVLHQGEEWRPAFDITSLVPGEYVLSFQPVGRGPAVSLKSVVVDGQDVSRKTVTVTNGVRANAVITFTGRTIRLAGVVRDDGGKPLAGGSVAVFPVDRSLWANQGTSSTWVRAATGNAQGVYQLTDLRAGDYFIVGVDPSADRPWRDPAFFEATASAATRIALGWGDTKSLDVKVIKK